MAKDIAPAPYDETRHWKWFARQLSEPVLAAILCIAGSVTWAYQHQPGMSLLFLALLFPVGLWGYGKWLSWKIRPIRVDPSTGTVEIVQTGYWWFFMSNSSPDSFSLTDVQIMTFQTKPEQIFFKRSETLVIATGGVDPEKIHSVADVNQDSAVVLTSVKDAYRINEIYKWWSGRANRLAAKQATAQLQANRLTKQLIREQRETNRLLRGQQQPPQDV